MTRIGSTGVGLLVIFAIWVTIVPTASAEEGMPIWQQCIEVESEGGFEDSKCTKTTSSGAWESTEIEEAAAAKSKSKGGIQLTDTGAGVEINCSLTDAGKAGPGRAGEVTEITATGCTFVKSGPCESTKPVSMKAVHLPWKTRLSEPASGEIRDTLTEGTSGAPGWSVECTVLGIFKTVDTCTGVTSALTRNGTEGTVEAEFEKNSAKVECTIGGKEAGRIEGIDVIEKVGSGLAVLKLVPGVYIRPAFHKFKKVGEQFIFKVWNFSNAAEEVESGKINPNEKAFSVKGGAGCFTKKIYVADPNKLFTCAVTIEELEANKNGKFEIKPKVFPVREAKLKS